MKNIDRRKLIKDLLRYIKIEYNLNKNLLNYNIKNNTNKIEFNGQIPLTNSDYYYLRSLEEKQKENFKNNEKKKAKSMGITLTEYRKYYKQEQNEEILLFIKEKFILDEITKNPIVLEVLLKTGKNGPLDLYENILHPVFQEHYYTFLNKDETYELKNSEIKEIKNSFLNLANKIGLIDYPISLSEKLFSEILSENPEFYPKAMDPRLKDNVSLFDKYKNANSIKEKEMFKNLILNSEFLMRRTDNPLNIEKLEKNGNDFYLLKIEYEYEYSIEWEGTFTTDELVTFMSLEEIPENKIMDILDNIYLPNDGILLGYNILSKTKGIGNDNYIFLEKNDNRYITRPGNQRFKNFNLENTNIDFEL